MSRYLVEPLTQGEKGRFLYEFTDLPKHPKSALRHVLATLHRHSLKFDLEEWVETNGHPSETRPLIVDRTTGTHVETHTPINECLSLDPFFFSEEEARHYRLLPSDGMGIPDTFDSLGEFEHWLGAAYARFGQDGVSEYFSSDDTHTQLIHASRNIHNGPIQTFLEEITNRRQADQELQTVTQTGDVLRYPTGERITQDTPPFRLVEEALGTTSGLKACAEENIEAISVLREIEHSGIPATDAQKQILSKYIGWGGIPQLFDERREDWAELRNRLKSLVSEEAYQNAAESTRNAHYTTLPIIRALYDSLDELGYDGRGRALEAGAGVGHFIGCSPQKQHTTAVEADSVSAAITRTLYDDADVHHTGFERFVSPGAFDLAIGNPPFGSERLFDANEKDLNSLSIHNFFLNKSMRMVRQGGLGAFVVSRFFLDAANQKSRETLYKDCDLIGAVRLPETAFRENARTDVVSDVVIFRKRLEGEQPLDGRWVTTGKFDELSMNQLMLDEPERILGEVHSDGKQQVGPCLTVRKESHTQSELGEALRTRLREQLVRSERGYTPAQARTAPLIDHEMGIPSADELGATETQKLSGALIEYDHQIYKVGTDTDEYGRNIGTRVEAVELSNSEFERLSKLLEIRNGVVRLVDSECNGAISASDIENQRQTLNTLVEQFVKTYKKFGSNLNRRLLRDDLHAPLVFSLYDDLSVSDEHKKAAILTSRVSYPTLAMAAPKTIEEAFTASLISTGTVNPEYCAEKLGISVDEAENELLREGLAFRDPTNEQLIDRDAYLSGNVRQKLIATEGLDGYEDNRRELAQLLPEQLQIADIAVNFSAQWIPTEVVEAFTLDVTGIAFDITRNKVANKVLVTRDWHRETGEYSRMAATNMISNYGTNARDAKKIIEDLLVGRPSEVYDYVIDDNGKRKAILNHKETARAKICAERWQREFEAWIINRANRTYAEIIENTYNNLFRSHVNRRYDGAHLQFPGMASEQIKLRKTQRDAAWRMVCEKRTLLDHVVGAGKTYTAVCGEAEKHRLGKANKSMIVVPNHLVEQWSSEILRLYPSANVLSLSNTTRANRQQFLAKVATGQWDYIVCAESTFSMIPVSIENQIKMLNDRLHELVDSVKEARATSEDDYQAGYDERYRASLSVKQIQKARKVLETRILRLQNKPEEPMITWEQLGIDSLVIDEAHSFKNLEFTTTLRRVSGLGPTKGSKKAFDLLSKIKVNEQTNPDSSVTFLTGTPISNTLSEAYHIMKYLCPDRLREMDVEHFDSWIGTFGKVTTEFESNLTGTGFVQQTRVSKFRNLPELQTLYRSFADTVTNEDLERNHQNQYGCSFPIPKTKGGKPDNQVGARSEEVAFGMEEVVQRLEHIQDVDPHEDNALKCLSDARKRGLDMRIDFELAPPDPNGRVERAAHNIVRIYKQWEAQKGTQLVFCDLSIPKTFSADYYKHISELQEKAEQGDVAATDELNSMQIDSVSHGQFSVYSALKDRVLELAREHDIHMPPETFKFIHEANTDRRKQALFEQVRSGEVRIVMGSTARMGTGMNVQERLVAEHDLDAPWRPADMEQRSGRILRQGNLLYGQDPDNFEVEIIRYNTERTAGAKEYQTLETKAKFIEQFRTGKHTEREADDIQTQAMSFTEMRALTSGREEILEEMQLRTEINSLEQAFREWENGRRKYQELADALTGHEPRTRKAIAWMEDLLDALTGKAECYANEDILLDRYTTGPIILTDKELDSIAGADDGSPLNITPGRFRQALTALRAQTDAAISKRFETLIKEGNLREHASLGIYKDRFDLKATISDVSHEGLHTLKTVDLDVVDTKSRERLFGIVYNPKLNAFSASGLRKRIENYIHRLPSEIEVKRAQIKKDEESRLEAVERCEQPFPSLDTLEEKRIHHDQLRELLGLKEGQAKRYESNVPRFQIRSDGSAWTIETDERLSLRDLEGAPDLMDDMDVSEPRVQAASISL